MKKKDNPTDSDALLCVTREIETIKKKLAALYDRKRELEDKAKTGRRSAEKVAEDAKHQLWLEMLEMAAKGMSVRKIAEAKGVSKHNMEWKLCRAWRKEFPAHFAVNYEKRPQMGFLSALRDSPPLFISAHNATVLAPVGAEPPTKP